MAYPPVQITNSTAYNISGKISYAVCKGDKYDLTSITTTKKDRGVCLLKKITSTVVTPNGNIVATPYTSSGTSYSRYAVIQTGPTSFVVTRIVTSSTDEKPSKAAPKKKQK